MGEGYYLAENSTGSNLASCKSLAGPVCSFVCEREKYRCTARSYASCGMNAIADGSLLLLISSLVR